MGNKNRHRKSISLYFGTASAKWKALIILLGCVILFFVCKNEYKEDDLAKYSKDYIGMDEVESMLSFTGYEKEEWKDLLSLTKDTQELKYVELKKIVENLGVDNYITYKQKADAKVVTRTVWIDVYEQMLDYLDTDESVQIMTELILAKKEDGTVVTQGNVCSVLMQDTLLECPKTYVCYVYENQIIGIKEISEDEAVIENVLLTASEETVNFIYQESSYELPADKMDENMSGIVCDLTWKDDRIIKISKKEETITGNLLTIDDSQIEIEGYGQLKRAENLPVYKTYGTMEEKKLSDVVIGNMSVTYIVAEDEVCALLINQPADLENIRVLLLNGEGGIFRENIRIASDTSFQVTYGDTVMNYEPGNILDAASLLVDANNGYLRIDPVENGTLHLVDETGKITSYEYDGSFEIRRYDTGFAIINDVPIEKYLYQVITSEMPSSYELEALKAQAVCARSYAYRQLLQSSYAMYGAHVDDSTNYQVYNKQAHTAIAKTVVDDTCGEVMECGGEIVEAYYFSTSCGTTETDDVWNSQDETDNAYLKSVVVKEDGSTPALADETAFYQYITSPDDTCFDAFGKFFRWNTMLSFSDETTEQMRQVMAVRKEVKPENIIFIDENGNQKETMEGFGTLLSMCTNGRGIGGVVLDLHLQYEYGSVEVYTEYNIRKVLGCMLEQVQLQDGSIENEMQLLPSAYFTMIYDDTLGCYQIYGGGYGHGVGMSQNGAQGMAQKGYGYRDILNFFYQNITVQVKGTDV